MSLATAAARSSVPPGFSLFAAISARVKGEHLVGIDGGRGGVEHGLLYHGARCYTPTRSRRSPRRSTTTVALARGRRPSRRGARPDRPRAGAVPGLHGAGGCALAPRRGDLVPGGCRTQVRHSPRPRCARRTRRSGSTRRCSTCSALCPRAHVRERHPRGAVRRSARPPAFTVNEAEIDEVLVFGIERLASAERTVSYDRPDGRTWRGFAYEPRTHRVGSDRMDAPRVAGDDQEGDDMADAVNAVAPEDRELRILLGEARTIAVVGLRRGPAARRSTSPPTCNSVVTASCP